MAITTCGNCIEFGTCTMCGTPTGFSFNGEFCAAQGFRLKPTQAQGLTSSYVAGGDLSPGALNTNVIQKYPFSSVSLVACVAALTACKGCTTGSSSSTHGYVTGGRECQGSGTYFDAIEKFPFASDANATDVGELNDGTNIVGSGQISTTHGYTTGGNAGTPLTPNTTDIRKYPFSSDSSSVDIGDTNCGTRGSAGVSSCEFGYQIDGAYGHGHIDKFPFASDTNATDVTEALEGGAFKAGLQSSEKGYTAGGDSGSNNIIESFPFASESSIGSVGSLADPGERMIATSSSDAGFLNGGLFADDTIQCFPFANAHPTTDVGELTNCIFFGTGHQV